MQAGIITARAGTAVTFQGGVSVYNARERLLPVLHPTILLTRVLHSNSTAYRAQFSLTVLLTETLLLFLSRTSQ